MLLFIWTVAITGLVLQVIFFKDFPELLTLALFLGLGWVGLLTMRKFHLSYSHESALFLAFGGIFYSIGALLEYAQWPVVWTGVFGPHEVFHLFVIVAAYCHWKFIYYWSRYPVGDQMTFDVQVFGDDNYVASSRGEALVLKSHNLETLKDEIVHMVSDHYWPNQAHSIRLKYFHEENLSPKNAVSRALEKNLNLF